MRILLISARSDIGGGPAQMYSLLSQDSDELSFYCALPSSGIYYERVSSEIGMSKVFDLPYRRFSFSALIRLWFFCYQNQIDLIHSHGKGAGIFSRILGVFLRVPVVHTLHGFHDGKYSKLAKYSYALYEKFALFATDKLICVSAGEAAIFRGKVAWSNKINVIQNGTEVIIDKVDLVRQPTSRACKVVSVSRLTYQKNVKEILAVAKRLPNCRFYIIGDGEDMLTLIEMLSVEKIANVQFLGELTDVLSTISDAHVFLSTSRWEGLPLAPLEAMSLGIPLVLSSVPGNMDVIHVGVNGYLYNLGNIDHCVEQINNALTLPRDIVAKCHRENYSVDVMRSQTYDIYNSLKKMGETNDHDT